MLRKHSRLCHLTHCIVLLRFHWHTLQHCINYIFAITGYRHFLGNQLVISRSSAYSIPLTLGSTPVTSSASISLTSSFCFHAFARLPYFMRCARSHAAEAVSAKTRRQSLQEKSGPEKRKWSSCGGRRIFAPGDRLTQRGSAQGC